MALDEMPLKIAVIGSPNVLKPQDKLSNLVHPFRSPTACKRPPESIQVIRELVALKRIGRECDERIEYGLKVRAVGQFVETIEGRTNYGVRSAECCEDE